MKHLLYVFLIVSCKIVISQQTQFAVLKYNGGGDYYANPTAVPNLVKFCNEKLGMKINPEVPYVSAQDDDLFNYPFLHMTGHGNVVFTDRERSNLRTYLEGGGFLHIDDNYGMDGYIRLELKKIYPELDLVEIPPSHPIFNCKYKFPNGLPKIHEHDDKRAQAFGLFKEGKLILLYTYESDLGDGWENPEVHDDPMEKHILALEMGANIVTYMFTNGEK